MAWPDEISSPYRSNILIVGPERAAEAELQRLRPLLPGSVHTCRLPGPLHLPEAGGAVLILRNVGALDPDQQSQLSQWLEGSAHGPVVSLHSSSLFDRVREGAFSEQLYYRLNIVLETADTAGSTRTGGE
jgi:hypothetical protein